MPQMRTKFCQKVPGLRSPGDQTALNTAVDPRARLC